MGIEKVGSGGRIPPVEKPQKENKGGKGDERKKEGDPRDEYRGSKESDNPAGTYDRRGRR